MSLNILSAFLSEVQYNIINLYQIVTMKKHIDLKTRWLSRRRTVNRVTAFEIMGIEHDKELVAMMGCGVMIG